MGKVAAILASMVASVVGLQEFGETPRYTEVNPGTSAVLECMVRGKGGECRWEKDGQPVGIFEGKYEWAGAVEQGNCSLAILDATSEYDDGVWQCQVTASNFKEGDSLISEGAEVVVRAPPREVVLEGAEQGVVEGVAGQRVGVECVARGGNPAPSLSFLVDGKPVGGGEQKDVRLVEGGWESRLVLATDAAMEQHALPLVCQADHPALPAPLQASATLDISFPPLAATITSNGSTIQEGSSVLLSCRVEARPVAAISWEREGEVVGSGATLLLPTVTSSEAGVYACYGENRLGRGEQGTTEVEVLYGPKHVTLEEEKVEVELGEEGVVLGCRAEGVPAPTYRWLRGEGRREVGRGSVLRLSAASYSHGGDYYCEATNSLGREESRALVVEVRGAPMLQEQGEPVRVGAGEDLEVAVRFCANPLPELAWHSAEGGLVEVLGEDERRSVVVEEEEGGHCYLATLQVEAATGEDAGHYLLQLENEHGEASHLVAVEVLLTGLTRELIIAIIAGAILTLLIFVFILVTRCRCKSSSKSSSKTDMESCGTSTGSENTRNEKLDSLEDLVFNESYESYRQPDLLPGAVRAGSTPSPAILPPPSYHQLCFPRASNCGSMRKARPAVNPADMSVTSERLRPASYTPEVRPANYTAPHQLLEHINTMSYSNYVGNDSLYHWRRAVDAQAAA